MTKELDLILQGNLFVNQSIIIFQNINGKTLFQKVI